MSKAKDLEDAVRKLLDVKGFKYISSKNQTVRCFKCQAFQKVRTQGFDFFAFAPRVMMIECKTGKGRLSKPQKVMQAEAESVGVPYIVVRDTVDVLLDVLAERGR